MWQLANGGDHVGIVVGRKQDGNANRHHPGRFCQNAKRFICQFGGRKTKCKGNGHALR